MANPAKGDTVIHELTRLDWSAFSLSTGFRAAAFLVTPVLVGLITGHIEFLFAAVGAFFLTQTEGQRSTLPWYVLLVACATESAAIGLGTLAATTNLLLPVLLGIAIFVALSLRMSARWAVVGNFTAITFAIGIALPGDSIPAAIERTYLTLIGGLFAVCGVELHRFLAARSSRASTKPVLPAPKPFSRFEVVKGAAAIAVTGALGFALGLDLKLPRDFWVVATIILAMHPNIRGTLSDTSLRIGGTVVGALIAAAITFETHSPWVLVPWLFVFAVLMFSTRGVNVGLVQVPLVPYLVILLNLIYPSQWEFAFYRILEVAIGGGLAIAAVYVLNALDVLPGKLKRKGASRESPFATSPAASSKGA
jgi:Fusaric acid resistance protein-like